MVQTAAVESILRQVRESAHREVVRHVLDTEEELDADWAPILARLRRDLEAATPAEVQGLVDQATRAMISAAVRRLTGSVTAGAVIGANAAAREHERLTGPHGPMQPHDGVDAGPATIGTHRARQIAAERISGAAARDRVPLSARLYRSVDQVGRDAGRVIRSSIQAREGIFQTAENFIASNRDAMRVPIPRYTQDLISAARESIDSGDRSILEDAIRKHTRQMERLGIGPGQRDGLTSLRSTVRQFVRDLEQATPQSLERIVARHLEDRAQFQARRIARHETMEAHRSAYLASVREKPYAVGVRWKLSGLGHVPDVCDCFANQNLYGLGAGGYPKDRVPETPHPMCRCTTSAIVDEHFFTRRLAQRNALPEPPRPWETDTRQTAAEWLAEQPESFRRRLLGPTRARIFDDSAEGRTAVLDGLGRPIPVAQLIATTRTAGAVLTVPVTDTVATARGLLEAAASSPEHVSPANGIWAALQNGWPKARHQAYEDALAYLRANPGGPQWATRGPPGEPPWRMTRSRSAGRFTADARAKFRRHEPGTAALLLAEGNDIHQLAEDPTTQNADLLIAGHRVELKALTSGRIESALGAIQFSTARAGQARNIVYDFRGTGVTAAQAGTIRARLLGSPKFKGHKLDFLRILGDEFDLTWDFRPAST